MSDIKPIQEVYLAIKEELIKVIKGQEEVIDLVLIAFFAGGHVLIEGLPGLGKTLLVNALSQIVGGTFKRIQFTPDLMPSDIIGTTVYNMESNTFQVKRGPVFTNLLLADEVNRSPAKTQSALLQAMQEKEVTIDGNNFSLGDFFMCLATQNPIELEGTFPLPEAQVDRFLMKINMTYPSREEENAILKSYREGLLLDKPGEMKLKQIIDEKKFLEIKAAITKIYVDDKIIDYITEITYATRDYPGIEVGASPRGSVALLQTSRVKAVTEGREYIVPDDIKYLAFPVLRHRLILEPETEIEGFTPDDYLKKIIESVKVPR
ncbi:MAG: MoxR family ATPase [Candidatus Aminicenantes bacterium]|jgi:MoxR-like ATPase